MFSQITAFLDKYLTKKGQLYLAIGLGVVALLLIVGAYVASTFSGGDATTVGGAAGAAALAAAAAAAASRGKTQEQVDAALQASADAKIKIEENQHQATTDMGAVPGQVADLSDEAKIRQGEDLFKPKG